MSLLGLLDYEGSSSSSSESEEDAEEDLKDAEKVNDSVEYSRNNTKLDLPCPLLESNASLSKDCQQSSVFYNPFKAEEKKKLDVLEKHVQLSNAPPPSKKTNTRICYKFQRGKCRFGDKCRFAHVVNRKATSSDNIIDPDKSNEEVTNDNKPKKRKVGVSDSLIPPKRAMKAFNELKEKRS